MAIGADWAQICNGINSILAPYLGKLKQVVNVNEALSDAPVSSAKIEIAHDACSAVVLDAKCASGRVAFVGVDADLTDGTLEKVAVTRDLLKRQPSEASSISRSSANADTNSVSERPYKALLLVSAVGKNRPPPKGIVWTRRWTEMQMVRDSVTEFAKGTVDLDDGLVAEKSAKLASRRATIAAAVVRAEKLEVARSEHAFGSQCLFELLS